MPRCLGVAAAALLATALTSSVHAYDYPTDCCAYAISRSGTLLPPLPLPYPAGTDGVTPIASEYPPDCCTYRFTDPALPIFGLPEAQPDSPGDINLSGTNFLVDANGNDVKCNGDTAEVWNPTTKQWEASYTGDDQQSHAYSHVFYVNNNQELWLSTLQTWQASLRTRLLQGALARLKLTCQPQAGGEATTQCVQFYIADPTTTTTLPSGLKDQPKCSAVNDYLNTRPSTYPNGNYIIARNGSVPATHCRGDTLAVWSKTEKVFTRRYTPDLKSEARGPVYVANDRQVMVTPVDSTVRAELDSKLVRLDLDCTAEGTAFQTQGRGNDCVFLWLGDTTDPALLNQSPCLRGTLGGGESTSTDPIVTPPGAATGPDATVLPPYTGQPVSSDPNGDGSQLSAGVAMRAEISALGVLVGVATVAILMQLLLLFDAVEHVL